MAQLPYRGSIPTAPSKGLTVEEMLKKYPKGNVEKAIYRLDYVSQRNRMIKSYEDMIDSGHNVELATKALDMYLESTPSEPPIDPDEPADLDPDVLWRIKCLKYIYHGRPVVRPESILDLDFESVDPDCMVNLNAILNAYRSGNLRVVAGEASVWFAGHLVIGPLPNNKLSNYEIIHKVSEWREKYGPGRVWEENPTARRRQRKFQGIMPAVDDNWTHIFDIRARLIGKEAFIVIKNVLDDTGSDYLELFSRSDCVELGLTVDYVHWKDDVVLEISSHETSKRKSIELEVQLLLNDEPFGPIIRAPATISPGDGDGEEHCSGMGFRRNLFTATSPYGNGDLHLSDMKTGVTRPLRAKPRLP